MYYQQHDNYAPHHPPPPLLQKLEVESTITASQQQLFFEISVPNHTKGVISGKGNTMSNGGIRPVQLFGQ